MSQLIPIPARIFTLFISEVILLYACYVAGAWADSDIADVGLFLIYDSGIIRIAIVVAFVVAGLFFRNLYAEVRIRGRLALFQELCLIFGLAFIGQGLISYIDGDWIIPRKMMLPGSLLGFAAVFGWRLLFDHAARRVVASGRVLFLGMSPTVVKLAGHFHEHPESGLMTIGYLESGAHSQPTPVTRLGTMADLDDVVDRAVPDSIVIGRREDIRPWWTDDFLALRFGGMRVEEAGTLYERVFARKSVNEIWPPRLIFRDIPGADSANFGFHSLYSQAIALAVITISLPLTLTVALLIRIGSRGPILVTEQRVGLHDAAFEAYRFRCTGPDGELTGLGRILRRYGLVWLPQLLNVIRGEMAMVGPRPERPLFARRMNELIPFYRQRHRVKPGVTGWARIHRQDGQEQDSLRDLEYDLYYLENLSPLLDFFILMLSLKTVGRSGVATQAEGAVRPADA
jgi:lipopolysaccharide/colanic/teichoic acid biosynthesis glycosyltransferase